MILAVQYLLKYIPSLPIWVRDCSRWDHAGVSIFGLPYSFTVQFESDKSERLTLQRPSPIHRKGALLEVHVTHWKKVYPSISYAKFITHTYLPRSPWRSQWTLPTAKHCANANARSLDSCRTDWVQANHTPMPVDSSTCTDTSTISGKSLNHDHHCCAMRYVPRLIGQYRIEWVQWVWTGTGYPHQLRIIHRKTPTSLLRWEKSQKRGWSSHSVLPTYISTHQHGATCNHQWKMLTKSEGSTFRGTRSTHQCIRQI